MPVQELLAKLNISEAEFVERVNGVINSQAAQYTFGYYDIDDIRQEAWKEILKSLHRYNPELPLENFLYVHVSNRLKNVIRNKYHRNDPPCKICHGQISGQTEHPDGKYCDKYLSWKKRNSDKKNLVCPTDISNIDDTNEKNTKFNEKVSENMAKEEIFAIIDLKLPAYLRADYLKIKSGVTIPKNRRDLVIKAIREFLTNDEINDAYES